MTACVPPSVAAAAAEVEAALAERLDGVEIPENLRDALRYAALDGGKRLRPTLVLLSCDAVGGKRSRALPAAMAIELIHCFSLVHDDLPAMDDDDLRRGRPTLHVRAGEPMAILAGDVMLSLAFQIIAEGHPDPAEIDPGTVSRQVRELATATTAMIGGQVYDTLGGFPDGLDDTARLRLIHRSKTGAILRVACRLGGLAGGADAPAMRALTRYGEDIGLMFQIVDDLLDVTQSAEHIGKATGKDERAGKLTFPGLLGIAGSRREVERLLEEALGALDPLGPRSAALRDLCRFMAVRTR